MKTLCYYITGHGYGHAIRSAQILKALPSDIEIIVKTTAPESILREELGARKFRYERAEYDCGCVQRDSVTILKRDTLDRYRAVAARNADQFDSEVTWLSENHVAVVATDIAPFPLVAAKAAGIPGIAISNFTWYDIYRDYVETADDQNLVNSIRSDYASASLALISELCLPTILTTFPRYEGVPLAARIGRPNRRAIDAHLNSVLPATSGATKLGVLYLGAWGLDIDWQEVEKLSDWRFVTYDPLDTQIRNVTVFDRSVWSYANTVSSADAMISKVGYCSVTECIANSLPEVHLPRRDFAEYDVLVAGMDRWGGRVELSEDDFIAGRWRIALDRSQQVTMNANAFRTDGAQVIARRLAEIANGAT